MALEIIQIPVLNDNYVYLVHDPRTNTTGVVDPAVPEPVLDNLKARGWQLNYILNTHHHSDHVGGNLALKAATGCEIVGPKADQDRIPGIDIRVGDEDRWTLGQSEAHIFDVPGHTRGHIAYWFADSNALFCGDTLFAMGCGRLFEGTPGQMWTSLQKFSALPDETLIYCAHEYTESNGRFALHIEPENASLQDRMVKVRQARAKGKPTVPSRLGTERATNPFLRASDPKLQKALGLLGADPVTVFAQTRQLKDEFRG